MIAIRGRVSACSDSDAAQKVHDSYPDAVRVCIEGPTPDAMFNYTVWLRDPTEYE